MSKLTDTFSPPVVVQLPDGREVRFTRMRMKVWAEMAERLRATQVAAENARINADPELNDPKTPNSLLVRQRLRADAHRRKVGLAEVMDYCAPPNASAEGIMLLLNFAMEREGVPQDLREEAMELIPPRDQSNIAWEIAAMPVVKPKADEPEGKGGDASPTGAATAPPADAADRASGATSPTGSSSPGSSDASTASPSPAS